MGKFKLGFEREIITPEVGGLLGGYSDNLRSTGVHDDLTTTVMVFESDMTRFVLISNALAVHSEEVSDKIRNAVSEVTGVAFENILTACTHTHTGPNSGINIHGWGSSTSEYDDDILVPQIKKAAKRASENMIPVKVGVGTTESRVGINRMECDIDNVVSLGQRAWGIYDPTMTVISFCDEDEKPVLNIIHYGAHCTAAGAITEISRDWAGYMEDRLEKETGAMSVFFNGPEGDVGPRLSNGCTAAHFSGDPDISYAAEIGGVAALDAIRAFNKIKTYRDEEIATVSGEIHLPYAPRLSAEEAKNRLENYIPTMPYENCQEKEKAYFRDVIKAWEDDVPEQKERVLKQTIFKIGNVVLVPFRFEAFAEIGLRLRDYSSYEHTLSIAVSNGNISYLPSEVDICRGGYEVFMFLTGGLQSLALDTDKNIIKENIRIMKELK